MLSVKFLVKGKPLWNCSQCFHMTWNTSRLTLGSPAATSISPVAFFLCFWSWCEILFSHPSANVGSISLESYVRDDLHSTSCYVCHLSLYFIHTILSSLLRSSFEVNVLYVYIFVSLISLWSPYNQGPYLTFLNYMEFLVTLYEGCY